MVSKKLMGKTTISILAAVLLVSCSAGSSAASTDLSSEDELSIGSGQSLEEAPKAYHPMSIPGLRKRNFEALEFNLLDEVPAKEGLLAREFSYKSEGHLIFGLIEHPAGPPPEGGWPVIILAHGYIPPETYSTVSNYRMVTRYYAAGGFMVVKPDYRSHGRSEGPEADDNATRTIDYSIDVMNLIAGIDSIPDADISNVFLYGHSMGGEIGLRILTVNSSLKGASLWAGVTQNYPENTLYFVRKRSVEQAQELRKTVNSTFSDEEIPTITPNNYLDAIDVPILVHHGTEDESVPFEWSIPFRARLDEAGVDYRFYEYPGENHNISKSFYKVMDLDMEFFRNLID